MAKLTGRAKSDIVLEAVEAYVAEHRPALGCFHLGEVRLVPRGELYAARLDR